MSEVVKHTPGPWEYRDNCIYPSSRQRCIARMDWHVRDEVDDTNARLIAAAPDLLGELQRMVEHFGAWASDHSEEATTETWSALHCAKAIIAKAEGQS